MCYRIDSSELRGLGQSRRGWSHRRRRELEGVVSLEIMLASSLDLCPMVFFAYLRVPCLIPLLRRASA